MRQCKFAGDRCPTREHRTVLETRHVGADRLKMSGHAAQSLSPTTPPVFLLMCRAFPPAEQEQDVLFVKIEFDECKVGRCR